MKITPKDEDFRKACTRLYFIDWDRVKEEALRIAADRLLHENQEEVRRLIEKVEGITRMSSLEALEEYLKIHSMIDKLNAEHDELLDIAYPRSRK